MAPRVNTSEEKIQARNKIIDAARELFVLKGVEAVTMREIAKKISYSPTTIYLYFKDKDDLLHALCVADFEQLGESLNTILQEPDPVIRMRKLGQAYASFAVSYPNHYQVMFMTTNRPSCEEVRDDVDPGMDSYQLLNEVVQDVYDAGGFVSSYTEPSLIAQTIWAAIHGVCALQITLGDDPTMEWVAFDARVKTMLQLLEKSLLKPAFQKDWE